MRTGTVTLKITYDHFYASKTGVMDTIREYGFVLSVQEVKLRKRRPAVARNPDRARKKTQRKP